MPMRSHNDWNVLVKMKPSNQQKPAVNPDATDFRLLGNISPMIAQGNGPKPENYLKIKLKSLKI